MVSRSGIFGWNISPRRGCSCHRWTFSIGPAQSFSGRWIGGLNCQCPVSLLPPRSKIAPPETKPVRSLDAGRNLLWKRLIFECSPDDPTCESLGVKPQTSGLLRLHRSWVHLISIRGCYVLRSRLPHVYATLGRGSLPSRPWSCANWLRVIVGMELDSPRGRSPRLLPRDHIVQAWFSQLFWFSVCFLTLLAILLC